MLSYQALNEMKNRLLKRVVAREVAAVLKEDLARGIPDFALSEVASDASEGLKRHLKKYIQLNSSDPVKQRQMYVAANQVLRDLEKDMKDLMEDKLQAFLRSV